MRTSPHRLSKAVGAIALAAACLTPGTAGAETEPTKPFYSFEAIDGVVSARGETALFSGLELGASEPIEDLQIHFNSDGQAARCERLALLVMERPGRYVFELQYHSDILSESWSCALRARTE